MCPENVAIKENMLSEYQKKLKEIFDIKNGKVQKLIYNLNDKNKCVPHIRNLKYYLQKGLILKKNL